MAIARVESELVSPWTLPFRVAVVKETTVTQQVPACRVCLSHMEFHRAGGLPVVLGRAVLVFLGAAFAASVFSTVAFGVAPPEFGNPQNARFAVGVLVAAILAALGYIFVNVASMGRLGPEHASAQPAVAISGFSRTTVTFLFRNDEYGRDFEDENEEHLA
jgi:hypothetical protein